MQLHRLASLFGASTLLLLGAYACGGDDDSSTPDADAGADTGTPVTDTGTTEKPDTGSTTDAGDGGNGLDGSVPAECNGNPLIADGGTGTVSLDGGQLQTITTGNFLYGPQYVDELGGQIVYTSFNDHTVVYTAPDGGAAVSELIDLTGEPNDLNQSTYWNGSVYTAMAQGDTTGGGKIYRLPLDGGTGTPVVTLPPANFTSPSGIAITKNGTVYVTDPAYQLVGETLHSGLGKINIDGGSVTNIVTTEPIVGIALNKDESKLFISTDGGQIRWYALDANGAITGAAMVFAVAPKYTPAGIAVDQGGNVWVAEYDKVNAQGAVEVFNPDGSKIWARVSIPNVHPTGVAFGGHDRKAVFITTENGNTASPLFKMSTFCPGTL